MNINKLKQVQHPELGLFFWIAVCLPAVLFSCSKEDPVPTSYTVTFDSQGGAPVPAAQQVESGKQAGPPAPAPTKAGYAFAGWYADEALTKAYDFSTPVTNNITLYAKWDQNTIQYTVTFNTGGGSALTEQSIKENGTATKPIDPTREGYAFAGWYADEALTTAYDFDSPVTSNITLYAKWSVPYTVTFDAGSGTLTSPASVQVPAGEKAGQPTDPTPPPIGYYTFKEWQKDSTAYNFDSPVTEDITLTAVYGSKYFSTEVTASAGFSGRSYHSVVVFDNKMWVIGGYDGSSNKNDVWSSPDGKTWTEATDSAAFPGRTNHSAVVFDDKMWVIGGSEKNDVWSSPDGKTWTQDTASAGFSRRSGHGAVIFNGKMWVIGGVVGFDAGGNLISDDDVWSSPDGKTWTQETASAAFSARGAHSTVVFNGKMWVIGGFTGSRKNDVWSSSDGKIWTQETASAGFSARTGHRAVVFNGKMWVIGGSDGSIKNDVWYSTDGKTWTELTDDAGFSVRQGHSAVAFEDKMWVIGGNDAGGRKSDVWY